jgi:3',5'-cyclic AMP phosphodiesterase CpdA
MKVIHLSDIHIGKSNNHERFANIVDWLLKKRTTHKSKIVVITGDIVDDGALWQYQEAKKQLDKLRNNGFYVLCTPGNHDYGPNGIIENNECIGYFRKYVSGDIDYPYCEMINGHAFVLLDSMYEEMRETEFWGAQGKLGKNQLRDLDKLLDDLENDSSDTKVIIALHHHPFYYNYFLKLRDDELFKKVITMEESGTSRVNCLLFGHKHVEKRFNDPASSKEEKYGIDIIFASGSTTERHSNGKMIVPNINLMEKTISRHKVA